MCVIGDGELIVDRQLLNLVRAGTCTPMCASTHQTCAADMRAFVDGGSKSSVTPEGRSLPLGFEPGKVFLVVAAMLAALLLLIFVTVIRMCASPWQLGS